MDNNIPPTAQQTATATELDSHLAQHGSRLHGNIHENREKVVNAFHEQMMTLEREGTAESMDKAREIAHDLITRAELPLVIRVRAHITLSTGDSDYLFHAQEALRLAEKGRELFGPGDTVESQAAVDGLIWEAREMARRAESDLGKLAELRAQWKAGKLKAKKGEKVMYGGKNYGMILILCHARS